MSPGSTRSTTPCLGATLNKTKKEDIAFAAGPIRRGMHHQYHDRAERRLRLVQNKLN